MSGHVSTDPHCRKHQMPRNVLSRWRFDRNRGRVCQPCRFHEEHGEAALACAKRWGFSAENYRWRP